MRSMKLNSMPVSRRAFLAGTVALGLSACASGGKEWERELEPSEEKVGVVDRSGAWIVDPEWTVAGPVRDGRVTLYRAYDSSSINGWVGLWDMGGSWVFEPVDGRPDGSRAFCNGRLAYHANGRYAWLNESGEPCYAARDAYAAWGEVESPTVTGDYLDPDPFSAVPYALVRSGNEGWGAVDLDGEWLLDPGKGSNCDWEPLTPLAVDGDGVGLLAVCLDSRDGYETWRFVAAGDDRVYRSSRYFDGATRFVGSYAGARASVLYDGSSHDGLWGVVGEDLSWALEPAYERVVPFLTHSGLFLATAPDTGLHGILGMDGWITEPVWSDGSLMDSGILAAKDEASGLWGTVDAESGEWAVSPRWSDVEVRGDVLLISGDSENWGVADPVTGDQTVEYGAFKMFRSLGSGLLVASDPSNEKVMGVIDSASGDWALEPTYENVTAMGDDGSFKVWSLS